MDYRVKVTQPVVWDLVEFAQVSHPLDGLPLEGLQLEGVQLEGHQLEGWVLLRDLPKLVTTG